MNNNREYHYFVQKLLQCRSIAPLDDGAIDLIAEALENCGFKCFKLLFSGDHEASILNLYAEIGDGEENLCFAGHTDVVGIGNVKDWIYDPFSATILDDKIYGRGTVDMKGAIAASIFASKDFILSNLNIQKYKLSFLISGNEEGNPVNGTPKIINWLNENNIRISACIIGEPTNSSDSIKTVKIGSRGSINFQLFVYGKQGHVAYPQHCHNPLSDIVTILNILKTTVLDKGSELFEASNLEFTSIDTSNSFTNVIPVEAQAKFNIRFSNLQTFDSLTQFTTNIINKITSNYNLKIDRAGEAYVIQDQRLHSAIYNAIKKVENIDIEFSTFGATSDGRFIKNICPVIEFGLRKDVAHNINEYTTLKELNNLREIYYQAICQYFNYNK